MQKVKSAASASHKSPKTEMAPLRPQRQNSVLIAIARREAPGAILSDKPYARASLVWLSCSGYFSVKRNSLRFFNTTGIF
ncbi:MAG: hypothetical protein KAR36_04440 [Candidatus Latescibacteria bacterium]|nr:hypothetical protein [Candidatus Latescibacterota bacterium]